ncbi:MAG: hypothetical protein BRC25_03275 [Parcubacteria group bacterium SW_6_46_9]|nr:MAG: hypothetical protein BRC25_03275 [Parcubacteria group bacterium SW_6_46_9]
MFIIEGFVTLAKRGQAEELVSLIVTDSSPDNLPSSAELCVRLAEEIGQEFSEVVDQESSVPYLLAACVSDTGTPEQARRLIQALDSWLGNSGLESDDYNRLIKRVAESQDENRKLQEDGETILGDSHAQTLEEALSARA